MESLLVVVMVVLAFWLFWKVIVFFGGGQQRDGAPNSSTEPEQPYRRPISVLDAATPWLISQGLAPASAQFSVYTESALMRSRGATLLVGAATGADGKQEGFAVEVCPGAEPAFGVLVRPWGVVTHHRAMADSARQHSKTLLEVIEATALGHRRKVDAAKAMESAGKAGPTAEPATGRTEAPRSHTATERADRPIQGGCDDSIQPASPPTRIREVNTRAVHGRASIPPVAGLGGGEPAETDDDEAEVEAWFADSARRRAAAPPPATTPVSPATPAPKSIYERAREKKARDREAQGLPPVAHATTAWSATPDALRPLKVSQFVEAETAERLRGIIADTPTGAGCAVLSGQSRIRFVVIYGRNLRAALEGFSAWVPTTGAADPAWCDFSARGFYGVECVETFEAADPTQAQSIAADEAARRDAAKPGCVWLWP